MVEGFPALGNYRKPPNGEIRRGRGLSQLLLQYLIIWVKVVWFKRHPTIQQFQQPSLPVGLCHFSHALRRDWCSLTQQLLVTSTWTFWRISMFNQKNSCELSMIGKFLNFSYLLQNLHCSYSYPETFHISAGFFQVDRDFLILLNTLQVPKNGRVDVRQYFGVMLP